jgi:hypothetical protein
MVKALITHSRLSATNTVVIEIKTKTVVVVVLAIHTYDESPLAAFGVQGTLNSIITVSQAHRYMFPNAPPWGPITATALWMRYQ